MLQVWLFLPSSQQRSITFGGSQVGELEAAQIRVAQQDDAGAQGGQEAPSGDGGSRAGEVGRHPVNEAAYRGEAHDDEREEAHEAAPQFIGYVELQQAVAGGELGHHAEAGNEHEDQGGVI